MHLLPESIKTCTLATLTITLRSIQTARDHGSTSIRVTSSLCQTNESIAYGLNSHNPEHPPWPLPRSAPGMRPRGHSMQRHGEGCAGSVGGGGGRWAGGRKGGHVIGWSCILPYALNCCITKAVPSRLAYKWHAWPRSDRHIFLMVYATGLGSPAFCKINLWSEYLWLVVLNVPCASIVLQMPPFASRGASLSLY